MNSNLPSTYRALSEMLAELTRPGQPASPGIRAAAAAARERLERDLLPRTAGGHDHLVVGIVGPNNAGKSLLFNSLAGLPLSPSEPQGGATRRLIGATSPALFEALTEEPSLAQFPLIPIKETPTAPLQAAKENAEDPASLLLVRVEGLTPGIVLIDAPDFDSILVANRKATESLLKVTDLALVVVTRHTYHNELVVSFLESWLRFGRPWALFYNEAYEDEAITREHAAQLSRELGSEPTAVFAAPFDIELQRQKEGLHLEPRVLGGTQTLADWLGGEERKALKVRALAASTLQLSGELETLRAELVAESSLAQEILSLTREPALAVGHAVAGRAMPPDPFLEAFRRVADQRIAPWRRGLRAGTRRLRLSIEGLSKRVLGGPTATHPKQVEVPTLEARELAPELGPLLEILGSRLGPGAPFWRRAGAGSLAENEALGERISQALAAAAERGPLLPGELRPAEATIQTFEERCEELISAEFELRSKSAGRRAGEGVVQFGVDLLHTLPLFAGIGTAIATGGVGADVATLFAGGIGAAMAERFTKFLGTNLARSARRRWQDLRGEELADLLTERALGPLADELAARARQQAAAADALAAFARDLDSTPAGAPPPEHA